ncbi:hypothetical protein [Rhodopseudomonas palustris]|uniref:hypothetical protein n=1 Tax=Rhodopseudomonas palustris TaxID=1076 RepID=UPI0002D3E082
MLLPKLLMRRGLARMAQGDARNAWPAPDFAAAPTPPGEGARRIAATAVVCNGDPREALVRLVDDASFAAKLQAQLGPLRPACSAVSVHLGLRGTQHLPPVLHVATPAGKAGLVFPSAVDPSCAPPGYSTLEIVALVDHGEALCWLPPGGVNSPAELEVWRQSPDYLARKAAMGDRLIARARARAT